jgi:hypothetical protein
MTLNKNGKKLIGILLIALLIIGIITFVLIAKHKDTTDGPPEPEATVPTMPNLTYEKISTKPWKNCAWLGGIDKELVTSFKFVETKNSSGAKEMWTFDDIIFYMFEDGSVEAVVGQSIKLTGSMNGAFSNLPNMTSINGFHIVDTSEVSDMSNLFKGCTSLTQIDIQNLRTEGVLLVESMFFECISLNKLDMTGMNMKKVVDADFMYAQCKSLGDLKLPDMDRVLSMSHLFEQVGQTSDCGTIIHGSLSTKYCEDMSYMFNETRIINIDIAEDFDTSNLKNADHMFADSGLMVLDLTKWNTSKLENASYMFRSNMFLNICKIDNWEVPSLKTCEGMFSKCTSLDNFVLNWTNMNSIKNTKCMFQRCYNLQTLDIRCLNGAQLDTTEEMFADCEWLTTIYCDEISAKESSLMFSYCIDLVGAVAYDETKIDISMANANGYFTKGE